MLFEYNEETGAYTIRNKKYKLVFPKCRVEITPINFDYDILQNKQVEGENETSGGASSTSGLHSRMNGDFHSVSEGIDQISIHNDNHNGGLSSPSSSPLLNGHCSPSSSSSSFVEVSRINNNFKSGRGRGRPPKNHLTSPKPKSKKSTATGQTLKQKIARNFQYPFNGPKASPTKIAELKQSKKTKEPVINTKKVPKQTSELPETIDKVKGKQSNLQNRKTIILETPVDTMGNQVLNNENNSKLTSTITNSEENSNDKQNELPSNTTSSSTAATRKVTNSVPSEEYDLPWGTSNGNKKAQNNKTKNLIAQTIKNKQNGTNKNGKRINHQNYPPPSLSSESDEEPVLKKPKQTKTKSRKTLGLKLPLNPPNATVTAFTTKVLKTDFTIPKKAPAPPQLILPTEGQSFASKPSRINCNVPNSSSFNNMDDDALLGEYVDPLNITENNTQDEIANEDESAVNELLSSGESVEQNTGEVKGDKNVIDISSPIEGFPVVRIVGPDSEDSMDDVNTDVNDFSDFLPLLAKPVIDGAKNNNGNKSSGEKEPEEEKDQIENSPVYSSPVGNNSDIDDDGDGSSSCSSKNEIVTNKSPVSENRVRAVEEESVNDNDAQHQQNGDKNGTEPRANSDNEDKEEDERNADEEEESDNGGSDDDGGFEIHAPDDDEFDFD